MSRLLHISVMALFFLASCQPAEKKERTLAKDLDSLFSLHPNFSGVLLVADKGKVVDHRPMGYQNYEMSIPMDTSTVFELASVSKTFTSMIILMLKQDGKINYDDLLEKYVPNLPYPGITIRHLLTHTSGLPDYQAIMDEHWDKSKAAGNADIIEYLKKYHPSKRFEPGQRYEYSNTGYVLLGSLAEAVAGGDFIKLCRERIFSPLKMKSTDIRSLEEKAAVSNFATGYVYVPETKKYLRADSFPSSNYVVWLGNRKGPGRVSSTAADLLKWDRALYTEQLVSQETLQEAFTQYLPKNDTLSRYGLGWMIRENPILGKYVLHTGDNPGFKTILIRFIGVDKTVILLSNNAYPDFAKLTDAIVSLLAAPNKVQ